MDGTGDIMLSKINQTQKDEFVMFSITCRNPRKWKGEYLEIGREFVAEGEGEKRG
jgi:hypothetical protein